MNAFENPQIEMLELGIEDAKKMVKMGESAKKLARGADFKKVVLEGYFVEEAARLALLVSDPNIPENVREFIMRDINGLGAFKRYLQTMVRMGEQAAIEISEAYDTMGELREEEEGDSE
jgi:hypothetical protein